MFRFIIPIILIGVSIAGVLMFTNPIYREISLLKGQVASYNQALDNSKALENERDKLTKKYNSITSENLGKLQKLLPNNVDNIRLILEIEKIASPYRMALKDIRYNPVKKEVAKIGGAVIEAGGSPESLSKDYGVWDLEFSTEGAYNNFVSFIKDLENNLRIVDVSSIEFSSDAGGGANPSSLQIYKYAFKTKTYWLKD